MSEIYKEKFNAYIMAMFIFQYGFLQPIASLVNSQIPIAGFSLLLLIALLLNNRFTIKGYVIFAFLLVSVYFLVTSLVLTNTTQVIMFIYLEFLVKSFSAFIIGSLTVDDKVLYKSFLNVSIINFASIAIYPIVSFLDSMNYMRFGYAMLPSVIMFFYAVYDSKFKNPIWTVLAATSLFLTLLYGSRGPIIVIFIFLLLTFVFSSIKKIKKIISISIATALFFFAVSNNRLLKLIDYIYFDLGITTYALAKLRMMFLRGLIESSSGRDVIYGIIFSAIQSNPYFGHGIGFITATWETTAHNIILQILVESGIFGLICWIVIWGYSFNKYVLIFRQNNTGLFRIITMITSIAVGRLLISSDMWLRPEYWFVISLLLSYNYKSKRGLTAK